MPKPIDMLYSKIMTTLSVVRRSPVTYQVASRTPRYVWGYPEFNALTGETADWSNSLVREVQRIGIDGRAVRRPLGFNWLQWLARIPNSNQTLQAIRSGSYRVGLSFGTVGNEQHVSIQQSAAPGLAKFVLKTQCDVDDLKTAQVWEGPHLRRLQPAPGAEVLDYGQLNEHLEATYEALQTQLVIGAAAVRIHVARVLGGLLGRESA